MTIPPCSWALIYVVQLLIPSLALGVVAVHLPRHLNGTRISRFLIGFAATPFLLTLWTVLLSAIFPGAPRSLFFLSPPALGIVPLALYGRHTVRRLLKEWRRGRTASGNPLPAYIGYACAVILTIIVISKLGVNAKAPVTQHDASAYLTLSLPFAKARSVSAIPDFNATIDEVVPHQSHSYLYPAFLAQALMTTGADSPGFPNDHAARVAIQVLMLYMFIAVFALASTSGYMGAGALALILLLEVPTIGLMSFHCHRDPFRVIPLLLLVAVLSGLSAGRLRHTLKPSHLVPCLSFAGFSLAAHTLHAIVLPPIVFAWLIWVCLEKAPPRRVAMVLAAIGIGVFLAGLHYIKSYVDTGNLMGYGFSAFWFRGNPVWDAWRAFRGFDDKLLREANVINRIITISWQDGFRLSVQGSLAAVLSLALWTKLEAGKLTAIMRFLGLIIVLQALLFVSPFGLGGIKPSDGFILNYKYCLHWYPFAAVCVVFLVLYLHRQMVLRRKANWRRFASGVLIAVILITTIVSWKTVALWPVADIEKSDKRPIWEIRDVLDNIPLDQRVLHDRSGTAYYLSNSTVFLFSFPAWGIIRARDTGELESVLADLKIRYILLEKGIHRMWPGTVLFGYVNDPEKASVIASGSRWRLYEIKSKESASNAFREEDPAR